MDARAVVDLLEDRLRATDFAGFAELFAEDAVFEYPFEHPAWPPVVRGRAAIRDHLVESRRHLVGLIELTGFSSVVHSTGEDGVFVLEHEAAGVTLATGREFRFASGVAVVTVRGGEVVRYRDYTNPFGSAVATGTLPQLAAVIGARAEAQ